jgi:hypothetical protein
MQTSSQLHLDVTQIKHADRLREAERQALVAAAVGDGENAGESHGMLSRLGALLPAARLSLHLAPRKTAGSAGNVA